MCYVPYRTRYWDDWKVSGICGWKRWGFTRASWEWKVMSIILQLKAEWVAVKRETVNETHISHWMNVSTRSNM